MKVEILISHDKAGTFTREKAAHALARGINAIKYYDLNALENVAILLATGDTVIVAVRGEGE